MIIFYSKKGCPWCNEARTYLITNNLQYEEREVHDNQNYYDEMVSLSGQTKAPTFVIDGHVLADASAQELDEYLKTQ